MHSEERRRQATKCVGPAAGRGADNHADGLALEGRVVLRKCCGFSEDASQQADADALHLTLHIPSIVGHICPQFQWSIV
jgi:hypothetical protein